MTTIRIFILAALTGVVEAQTLRNGGDRLLETERSLGIKNGRNLAGLAETPNLMSIGNICDSDECLCAGNKCDRNDRCGYPENQRAGGRPGCIPRKECSAPCGEDEFCNDDGQCKKTWRDDLRCGQSYWMDDRMAECDPNHAEGYTCCSAQGYCGKTEEHCECKTCIDFSNCFETGYEYRDTTGNLQKTEASGIASAKLCQEECQKNESVCTIWTWNFYKKSCVMRNAYTEKRESDFGDAFVSGTRNCGDVEPPSTYGDDSEEDEEDVDEDCALIITDANDCVGNKPLHELCGHQCAELEKTWSSEEKAQVEDKYVCTNVSLNACEINATVRALCAKTCAEIRLEGVDRVKRALEPSHISHIEATTTTEEFEALLAEPDTIDSFLKDLNELPLVRTDKALGGKLEQFMTSEKKEDGVTLARAYVVNTPGHSAKQIRRALQVIDDHEAAGSEMDTLLTAVNHVATFAQISPLKSKHKNILADIASTVTSIQDINNAPTVQQKARKLLVFKLEAIEKIPKLPGSFGKLISFASTAGGLINDEFEGENIDSSNKEQLKEALPGIALSAVLEVIGNGHLKDLKNLYDMAKKVRDEGDLKAIDVADILTLTAGAMRTGCLGISFVFPGADIPCRAGVMLIEGLRDSGILELIPGIEEALDSLLDEIQNNPFVKFVIAPVLKATFEVVEVVVEKVKRTAIKAMNVIESIIGAGVDIIRGKNGKVGAIQRLKGTSTKDKRYALLSGENTKCATGEGENPSSTLENNLTLTKCKHACDKLGDGKCYGYTRSKTSECLLWTEPVNISRGGEQKDQVDWNGCWARGAEPFTTKYNLAQRLPELFPGSGWLIKQAGQAITAINIGFNHLKKRIRPILREIRDFFEPLTSFFSFLR